jgi:dihydrodipicolinate synthase/N-acetylneuraminate lyase
MASSIPAPVSEKLRRGMVIPACPLALNRSRKWDERRQRALIRYYFAAGAGGLAVGVHTTQFQIHDAKVGLYEPLLRLAAEEFTRYETARRPKGRQSDGGSKPGLIRVAGLCGSPAEAVREGGIARELGYQAGLLNLAKFPESPAALLDSIKRVAGVIPIFGFYLQPAVGGRVLPYSFWRKFAEIENIVAIKIAPFNRYQTLDVVRAVAETGRDDIALYTGNDDNLIADLLTPYRFRVGNSVIERRIVGGLLGHWAVWTRAAVEQLSLCHAAVTSGNVPAKLLQLATQVTDANAAFFDAANGFSGCIAGLHEVLRRQGLLEGNWCLDPNEALSPGQKREIDRVYRAYPHLNDDAFVDAHRDEWLSG